jgi:hypothetical protein
MSEVIQRKLDVLKKINDMDIEKYGLKVSIIPDRAWGAYIRIKHKGDLDENIPSIPLTLDRLRYEKRGFQILNYSTREIYTPNTEDFIFEIVDITEINKAFILVELERENA